MCRTDSRSFSWSGNPRINGVSPFAAARQCGAGAPGLIWLSGYRSEMESTKATALDAEAERRGLGLLRFDYSGHGRSDGRIEEGTISRWLEETLAIVRAESEGPQILVGSSMGGYLALLAARALHEAGRRANQGPDSHRAGRRLHRGA